MHLSSETSADPGPSHNRVQRWLPNRGDIPPTVTWAILTLFAHAALHFLVPPIMEIQRNLFVEQFQRMNPGRSASQVAITVKSVLTAGLIYHLIFGILFIWLALKIRAGRNWARIAGSVVLVLGGIGTFFSFSSLTPTPALYKTLNIISWFLALATLGLLWLPRESRAYFTTRKTSGKLTK